MRTELNTIELIENYLLNALSDAEKQLFEERMATDPNFENEVELQEQLVKSLERISLQQTIQNAHKTYTFWKLAKLIGLIVIPIMVMMMAWFYLNAANEVSGKEETIQPKVEQQKALENHQTVQKEVTGKIVSASVSDTVSKQKIIKVAQTKIAVDTPTIIIKSYETIPSEIFTIQTEKDTIVETRNGIVFLIPKDAFVDANQQVITGNIALEIKEALDPMTIMTSGLTTLYNDKPLETGGMFFIEATKDGEKLQLNSEKEIIADIPTSDYKDNMQLFDGEIDKNGTINWTNPKPLRTALIPQDIESLNFYPPNYLETLTKKGYDITNKKFTDSLYYSFSNTKYKKNEEPVPTKIIFPEDTSRNSVIAQDSVRSDIVYDTLKRVDELLTPTEDVFLGLDPLKVKTIWNERYQNTFIATKAFEERLKVIHQNCATANTLLDIYVNNLDRDLYVLDSIAAYSTYSDIIDLDFNRFAKQRLTNVANLDADVSKLNDYYLKQQKVYRLALLQAQRKIDSLVNVDATYQAFSKKQLQTYYVNELAVNTKKVANDIGVKLPRVFDRTTIEQANGTSVATIIKKEQRKRTYRASVRTTGWKNIDRIINEQLIASVQSRTTATFQNKTKKTTITYSNYEVMVQNNEAFDNLFVYIVPNEFNSFVKLKAENDRFTYSLNNLLKYQIYCVAYINDVPFYFSKNIKNAYDKVKLTKTTKENLHKQLAVLENNNSSLATEVSYQVFRRENKATLKSYRKIVKLKQELKSVVFPCRETKNVGSLFLNDALSPDITTTTEASFVTEQLEEPSVPFGAVEKSPVFPGCDQNIPEEDQKNCFENKVKRFIRKNFNMDTIDSSNIEKQEFLISFSMKIDQVGTMKITYGTAANIQIREEIGRVAALFPKVLPGKQNGVPVNVNYSFSIVMKL